MPRITEFQPTPNPNALKCVLDAPVSDRPRSYRSVADLPSASTPGQAADPLAVALFSIPGVAALLINGDWVSVNKAPDASWATLKPAIARVLNTHTP